MVIPFTPIISLSPLDNPHCPPKRHASHCWPRRRGAWQQLLCGPTGSILTCKLETLTYVEAAKWEKDHGPLGINLTHAMQDHGATCQIL